MKISIALLASFGLSAISAHSWLDCIGAADQQYSGPDQFFSDEFYSHCIGYPRGYPGRMHRWINDIFTILIENKGGPNKDAAICGHKTQGGMNYTSKFPMTKIKAGEKVKLWYELDNHYTVNPTYVYLWGHGKPNTPITKYSEQNDSTLLDKHVFATPENCKNIQNANSLCWGYWTVPETWVPGTYSILWNWQWNQNPSGEEYNTCFDIEVTGGSAPAKPTSTPSSIAPSASGTDNGLTPSLLPNKPNKVVVKDPESPISSPSPIAEPVPSKGKQCRSDKY